MPCFKILTNIPTNNIPKDFVNKIIPVLSRTVKKEGYRIICVISGDCQLSFGGDDTAPGAVATLESIGNVGPEANKLIAKDVSDFVHKELGVHPDRFFMSIYDIQATHIVKGGTTLS